MFKWCGHAVGREEPYVGRRAMEMQLWRGIPIINWLGSEGR